MSLVRSKQITLNSTYSISTAHIKCLFILLSAAQLHLIATPALPVQYKQNQNHFHMFKILHAFCILVYYIHVPYTINSATIFLPFNP